MNVDRQRARERRRAAGSRPDARHRAVALRVRDAAAAYRCVARPRRLGSADACRSDGAQHPGDPRRRREPHLLRRPLPRLLDLRRRFRADPGASIRIRRRSPACTGSASCSTSAATASTTGPSSTASSSASRRAAGRAALRHPAEGPHPARARAAAFCLQLIEPEHRLLDVQPDERLQRVGLGTPDVLARRSALRERGVEFVESRDVHSEHARRPDARSTSAASCSSSCTTSADVAATAARAAADIGDFGMDTISLAGTLEAKLRGDARRPASRR